MLLPVLFDFKETPSILSLMFFTIIPLLVLRIGTYYSVEKREIELFILNENYYKLNSQLTQLLNLLPEAVIITTNE